jgi:hypothetical protein
MFIGHNAVGFAMNHTTSVWRKALRLCALLILVSAAPLLSSCSTASVKEATEKSIAQFRSHYDAERYHEIYSAADEEVTKVIAEPQFTSYLALVQQMLGKVKTANQTKYMVNTDLGRTLVIVVYNTDFERGTAEENFVWKIKSGQARLFYYQLNPSDSIMSSLWELDRGRLPPADVLLGQWLSTDGQTHLYLGKREITSVTPQDVAQSTYTIESVDRKDNKITIKIRITPEQYDILSFGPDRRTMTAAIYKGAETPDKSTSYIFINDKQQP